MTASELCRRHQVATVAITFDHIDRIVEKVHELLVKAKNYANPGGSLPLSMTVPIHGRTTVAQMVPNEHDLALKWGMSPNRNLLIPNTRL